MKKIAIIVLLLSVIGLQGLYAGFDHEVAFVSSYVWRGFDLYPKNKPALQPSITYTFGKSGFSVNVWASFVLSDRDMLKELEEIDFTFNYDFKISENVSLSAGLINYGFIWGHNYSFKNNNTQEVYVTVGLPKVFLAPSFSIYYDFNLGDGLYASLSAGHSVALSEKVNLDLGASLGYNGKQWIAESGISDLTVNAAIPFTVGKLTLTPSVNLTHVFLEELYRSGDKKDKFWFGITAAIK